MQLKSILQNEINFFIEYYDEFNSYNVDKVALVVLTFSSSLKHV